MKIFMIILALTSMMLLGRSFKANKESVPSTESMVLLDSVIGSNTIRIMKIQANMVVDTADDLLALVDRAKAKGANTVVFGDSKLNRFGIGENPGNTWFTETQKFVDGVKERNMDLYMMTVTMGFCGSVIATDPNLTTGYPIKDQPMKVQNGVLKTINTATITNGGFENFNENVPDDFKFQDAAGTRTFIDTAVKRSGSASFRAEAKGGEMSRIVTTFPVKPFHQYTLRFWIKTENLTAQNLQAIIRDENNKNRNLTNLRMSTPMGDGSRDYFNRPNKLTLNDWTEMRLAFNSLNATEVNLGLSLFGGTSGKIWWDDVEVIDTPVLNWLNRDDLPRSVKRQNGAVLNFGTDIELPVDEKLGQSGFSGKYDTHHSAPVVKVASTSSLKEGETVLISGYHALPTANGQISCSWNNPEVYARMRMIHQRIQDNFSPDGFFLNYSEIRTGGWEPLDTNYNSSGEALAASIERAYKDLFEVAPNAKHLFWNDMVDPNHNAKTDYYQVNTTLEGAWETLDPKKVVIATWWEGQKIADLGPSSLNFFADRGFEQVLGAFYDADVQTNFDQWQAAGFGVKGVKGNIYATWRKDYSKIEEFGDLWWAPGEQIVNEKVDTIVWNNAPDIVSSGETYRVTFSYEAREDRDIIILFQQDHAPWKGYGWARTTVTKGSGTKTLEFTLKDDIPVLEDEYKWTVLITPKGGNWSDKLDVQRIIDVDCEPLGVSLFSTENSNLPTEMQAYPNPANEQFRVTFKNALETVQFATVLDLNGRAVRHIDKSEMVEETDLIINTADMREGLYLLKLTSSKAKTETIKFIVEH